VEIAGLPNRVAVLLVLRSTLRERRNKEMHLLPTVLPKPPLSRNRKF
jgi:hypothetical protein